MPKTKGKANLIKATPKPLKKPTKTLQLSNKAQQSLPKRPRGKNRIKLTPKKQDEFIQRLSTTCNVTEAAKLIGIRRETAYQFRDQHPEFKAAWENAINQGIDSLEREARHRAAEGTDEPVFHRGQVCGAVRKYSDTLLIFLLKAHRPDKFRDRVELTGKGGSNLFPDPDPNEIKKLAVILAIK